MKVVWVTRSFLDYRIPVYDELCRRIDRQLTLFYNADYVPDRVSRKARAVLGKRAVCLRGELHIGRERRDGMANSGVRIPYQRGLIKRILKEKPDIIISDGFFQWTYAALWLRATRHTPHVMCYERTAHTERNAQQYRTMYRKLATRWIDAICCNGRLCGEYVQGLGFPAGRITYGHMVADVNTLREGSKRITTQQIQQKRSELDIQGVVFLYVGQIIPRKGVMQLLEAWKMLPAEIGKSKCSLLLVGGGSQESECRDYCKKNKLDNVRFTGEIDYDVLPLYYRCGDVFIMPTLEDNWALVVPEAMACGLPVICSKYNGCWPELVRPENGWVFDPLDVSDTANALQICLTKHRSLQTMGEASANIVNQHTAAHAAQAITEACDIAVTHCGSKDKKQYSGFEI
jgi:glycosyltransferase involved in cell wall biosynthesis